MNLTDAIEALVFAAAEPLNSDDITAVFDRVWDLEEEESRRHLEAQLAPAVEALKARWRGVDGERGIQLVEVAGSMTFRTNPRFAEVVQAFQEKRPVRLSRAALETLAIVAYRQPVTKPEIDHIRGVDTTATTRLLLDRGLIRIAGKRDEPGRPIIYGTTREFLSFFNLGNLAQLPTLRDVAELSEEAQQELEALGGQITLQELQSTAQRLSVTDDETVVALDQAMAELKATENNARVRLVQEGIVLEDQETQGAQAPTDDPAAQSA